MKIAMEQALNVHRFIFYPVSKIQLYQILKNIQLIFRKQIIVFNVIVEQLEILLNVKN